MAINGNYYGDKSIKYYDIKVGTDTVNSYIVGSVNGDGLIAEKLPIGIDDLWLEFDGNTIDLCINLNQQVENKDIYITGSLEYEDSSEETHNENVDYNATIDQPSSYLAVTLASIGMNILWATADVEIWDDDTGTLLFRGEVR